jgi:excisionase family DNA binding protein
MQTVYTVKEAADLLRMSEETIRRRMRDGSLRASRAGKGVPVRITALALDDFSRAIGAGPLFPELEGRTTAKR